MAALRLLLLAEGASFVTASLVHRGVLVGGYEHDKAAVAETVIGAVLLGGALLAWLLPARTRAVAIAVQAFALLGTCVGVAMIAIGVGPRTAPDLAYHASIVAVLLGGLVLAARGGRRRAAAAAGQGARS